MFVGDFSDLPGGWQQQEVRGGFWLLIALLAACLAMTAFAMMVVPDLGAIVADAAAM